MSADRPAVRPAAGRAGIGKASITPVSGASGLEASWRRCAERYNLDIGARPRILGLTSREVREHQEPFDDLLVTIDEELDYVWLPLSSGNFSASFSNMAGTIVYYRSDSGSGNHIETERAGTLWAEGIAGTNGVGTCVVERRPTEVFQTQHYLREFAAMSCAAAPVLSADSEMTGVLNFCTADTALREDLFLMVAGLVRKTAERLNNHLFHRRYAADTILKARSDSGPLLLALDGDGRLAGANHLARRWLGLADGPLPREALTGRFEIDGRAEVEIWGRGAVALRHRGDETVFDVVSKGGPHAATPDPARIAPAATRRSEKSPAAAQRLGRPAAEEAPSVERCLGGNPGQTNQLKMLRRAAASRLPVLLLGETGCGKDSLARALHREGGRCDKPFVAVNCAAVPESLIDSELFGYGAGAFTGARREGNVGRLVEADGGTLFLDELGDMPLALQTRLLRVLESGEVSPLGSAKTRIIDVQVVAATNHDLKTRVAEGRFRADLYHRLAGVVITLPPLRDRDDAVQLFHDVLARLSEERVVELTGEAIAAMRRYRWPGNMRELKFTLQRALALCDGDRILSVDLMLDETCAPSAGVAGLVPSARHDTARAARSAGERAAIADALANSGGDVAQTAALLNVSRATLYRKLKLHGLHR